MWMVLHVIEIVSLFLLLSKNKVLEDIVCNTRKMFTRRLEV